MKKMQAVSALILVLTLAVMAVNRFAVPLPDWAVRATGVVMLLSMLCTVYGMVRRCVEK